MKSININNLEWEYTKLFENGYPYELMDNIKKYKYSEENYKNYEKSVNNLRVIIDEPKPSFSDRLDARDKYLLARSELLKDIIFKNKGEINFDDLILESFGKNNPNEELKFISSRKHSDEKYNTYINSLFEVYCNCDKNDDYMYGTAFSHRLIRDYKMALLDIYRNIVIENFDFSSELSKKIEATKIDLYIAGGPEGKKELKKVAKQIIALGLIMMGIASAGINYNNKDNNPDDLPKEQTNIKINHDTEYDELAVAHTNPKPKTLTK